MGLTIIITIVVLSLLIFAHEFGHFIMARKFGVKAEEFGFGFPPRFLGIYKNKEGKWKIVRGGREVTDAVDTIYSINWLPLGGFVKIKGESGEHETDADSFASKSIWQRLVMLSAGVLMNVFLAMALIIIGFMIGIPQAVNDLDDKAIITDKKIQIVQVLPESPAFAAGLKMGDVISSVDGNEFVNYENLENYTNGKAGENLEYKIKRGQETITINIVPETRPETGRVGVGIAIVETGIVKYPWHLAFWHGIKTTLILVWAIIVAFFGLIKGLILGQGMSVELAGPVGIAALTGQMARMGVIYLLQFTALLSINFAIINFFPFPALDGGRVLFLIIEKIKGSPVKREVETIIHNLGFLLLMLLIVAVTYKDVARFSDKFKMLFERIIG